MLTGRRFENSDDGFVEVLAAVADYPDRVWAVEGANGIDRSIAQRLVGFDECVFDVPAKLATRVRVYSTGHGTKTDNTDATCRYLGDRPRDQVGSSWSRRHRSAQAVSRCGGHVDREGARWMALDNALRARR